jgi:hypothetical protein
VWLYSFYNHARRLAVKISRRRGIRCHLPFFGSGRKSTNEMRLCPVAVAARRSVRIVACVRPRSRYARAPTSPASLTAAALLAETAASALSGLWRFVFVLHLTFATRDPLNTLTKKNPAEVLRPQCRLSDPRQTIGLFVGPCPITAVDVVPYTADAYSWSISFAILRSSSI